MKFRQTAPAGRSKNGLAAPAMAASTADVAQPARILATLAVMAALLAGIKPATAQSGEPLPPEFDLTTQVASTTGRGLVRIRFDVQNKNRCYYVTVLPGEIALSREDKSNSARIGTYVGVGLESARQHPLKITIKRRAGHIVVLANARLAMDVEDTAFRSGTAAIASSGGATATTLRTQPIDSLYFTDDFMRQPTESGEWTYARGDWRIQTIGIVDRSANPFSLESRPSPDALAFAGYPFWSSYLFECAVKGNPDTSIGLCADLQDEHNYYLLRWTGGAKGSLDLLRVVDGKETVLASKPGGFIPGLWYMVGLRTTGGRLIAEVDHQRVLNVADTTFGEGKIGLYSSGNNGLNVWFDSVTVRTSNLVYDDFSHKGSHYWQISDNRALGGDPALADYTVTAQVDGGHTAGIPLRYKSPSDYYIFITSPGGSSLYAIVGGKKKLLDSSSTGLPASGRPHLLQAGVENGYLWGAIDGKRVVEAVDFGIPSGCTGYYPASGAGRVFQSITVEPTTPPEMFDNLTPEFRNVQHHPEMGGWSGPLHAWETATFGNDSGYWHKGALYGNTTVKVPLIPQDLQNGQFAIVLNSDGKTSNSGYEVDYSAGATGINIDLLRLGKKVASGHIKTPIASSDPDAPTPTLDIYRMGQYVYAGIGSSVIVRYLDRSPLDGYALGQPIGYAPNAGGHSRLGLIVRGSTPVDIPNIVVTNRHVYAETFHLAPVNWRPQSGEWTVTSRWSCQPGWTWYGGKDPGYAVNWNKSPMYGDQSIDYYAGVMMSAEPNSGAEAWRDLDCSFCSDGVNLFSGYTVVIGGWNGTMSRLFRKGKVVAESDGFHFPPQGVSHRLWFDVHAIKEGPRIRVAVSYVDAEGQNQVFNLMDWTDPQPLSGGFVGFWTYDNGMLIARTVLSYQDRGTTPTYWAQPAWLAREPADAPYPSTPNAGIAVKDLTPPAEASAQVSLPVPTFPSSLARSALSRGATSADQAAIVPAGKPAG